MIPRAASLLAAVLLAAATGGCNLAPAPGKKCDTELHEPVVSIISATEIEGLALSVCDVAPDEHFVHVSIELRQPGGAWEAVPTLGGTYTECAEIPRPGKPALCSRYIPCVDGHYRTVASVTGAGQGIPFSFIPPERPENTVRCPT